MIPNLVPTLAEFMERQGPANPDERANRKTIRAQMQAVSCLSRLSKHQAPSCGDDLLQERTDMEAARNRTAIWTHVPKVALSVLSTEGADVWVKFWSLVILRNLISQGSSLTPDVVL